MTIEVRAIGASCNLRCRYCYENLERSAGGVGPGSYDLEKIKTTLEEIGKPFILFGGEALLMPEPDLEDLWRWGFEKFGQNGMQTNGALINNDHIEMFRKYNVHVGFSVDGPGELNDARWAGSLEKTREATARTLAVMERLSSEEGIGYSLIVTLHRGNAAPERLPVMQEWFRSLDARGLGSARLHILQADNEGIRRDLGLTPEENIGAFMSFHELEKELSTLRFDIFTDMKKMLLGEDDKVTCTYKACDQYSTGAATGVEGDGRTSNCGRADKDGINVVKCDTPGFERYIALYHTPQDYGGCKGCRFFLACKGECPGDGIDKDWRNRNRNCGVWKALFEHVERDTLAEGKEPISRQADRGKIEALLLESWSLGENITIAKALEKLNGGDLSKCACPQNEGRGEGRT